MSQEKKPLIGIPGFSNSDKMFGVTGHYMEFANKFGDVRILMPHEEFVEVDLLILPGGLDLSPTKYGRIPEYKTSNHDVFKEFFFENRLKNYIDAGTPTFGICLGFQMLNVFFGGTLTQNLLFHPQSACRGSLAHEIHLTENKDKVFKENKKPKKIEVNSHHHQAILTFNVNGRTITDLAPDLRQLAYAHDIQGEITESFIHKTLPVAGVQWHPEEIHDSISRTIINSLLKQGKNK